jgi:hypothetical protein
VADLVQFQRATERCADGDVFVSMHVETKRPGAAMDRRAHSLACGIVAPSSRALACDGRRPAGVVR